MVRRIRGCKGKLLTARKGKKKCWELGTRPLRQVEVCAEEVLVRRTRIAGGFSTSVVSEQDNEVTAKCVHAELPHSTLQSASKYSTQHCQGTNTKSFTASSSTVQSSMPSWNSGQLHLIQTAHTTSCMKFRHANIYPNAKCTVQTPKQCKIYHYHFGLLYWVPFIWRDF